MSAHISKHTSSRRAEESCWSLASFKLFAPLSAKNLQVAIANQGQVIKNYDEHLSQVLADTWFCSSKKQASYMFGVKSIAFL